MDRAVPEDGFHLVEVEVLERTRQQQELVMWLSEKPKERCFFLCFLWFFFFFDGLLPGRSWGYISKDVATVSKLQIEVLEINV